MQCTPEEIELKRRQAQLKLEQKKQSNSNIGAFSNLKPSSPLQKYPSNNSFFDTSPGFSRNNSLVIHSHNSPLKHSITKPYDKPKLTVPFNSGKSEVTNGTCYLISEDRFCIDIKNYCPPAIEVFKSIPSKSYSEFSVCEHFQLIKLFFTRSEDEKLGFPHKRLRLGAGKI